MTAEKFDLSGDWDFDPAHTRIGFSAKHAMVSTVRGAFNDVAGHLHVDFDEPENSAARVVLQVASVDTRSTQRDDHLRSGDFFDAETWPEIAFHSTRIEEVSENALVVFGDLTIRDVTKQVTVPIEFTGAHRDAFGALRAGFEGTRRLDRREYGLEWNMPLDAGGLLVSEKITLEFEISAVKREGEAAGDVTAEGGDEVEDDEAEEVA
ncbi:YceI family protein [Microbacterium horticulturae]|uniref:YceI family protein n=1 Tax=Microbacterium horticulturae TaxID=3028316 RepID=A0ABY8BWK3_9MICO|nr:YceI family protein [Microbacterium sp. KACC 23027]WEG07492.1 YceI family protein [Microbacterium sp. KACC 23027]